MFVRSVGDLTDAAVDSILTRAEDHRARRVSVDHTGTVVGLVFLETSLRTRVGFAAAAARLGAATVEVLDQRHSPVSMPESLVDTLRTVGGYVDAIVARVDDELVRPVDLAVPLISGGDRGPRAEHPTQALIDLFALRQLPLPIAQQTLAVCGDLRMRSARSFFGLLSRRPPRKLLLVTEAPLEDGFALPPELAAISERRPLTQLDDADVLYLVGIPHRALDEDGRTRLRVTPQTLAALKSSAVVLSPLPVIDEVDADAYHDPRMRFFQQSDDGLYVRMAVLEFVLDQRIS
jgi:aspartate carbamoyltransferase catalytic subunit